jgi:hypothetical protein
MSRYETDTSGFFSALKRLKLSTFICSSGLLLLVATALAFRPVHAALAIPTDPDPGYKAEPANIPVPQELAGPVRAEISSDAIRVTGPDGAFCEIWLRTNIPPAANMNRDTGVIFGQIAEGTLIGAIHFEGNAADFHNQSIRPGIYTLRYQVQPVDASHTGVSPFRDFLLLVPAGVDLTPAPLAGNDLLDASKKASGTQHPSVWSLLPDNAAPVTLPATRHGDPGDFWTVYFRASIPAAPGNSAPAVMGLIIVGHAATT